MIGKIFNLHLLETKDQMIELFNSHISFFYCLSHSKLEALILVSKERHKRKDAITHTRQRFTWFGKIPTSTNTSTTFQIKISNLSIEVSSCSLSLSKQKQKKKSNSKLGFLPLYISNVEVRSQRYPQKNLGPIPLDELTVMHQGHMYVEASQTVLLSQQYCQLLTRLHPPPKQP